MITPNVIYLIDTGDEISWCDDPNPSGYIEPDDVVMYVKSSIDKAAPELLEALKAALSDIEFLCERIDAEVGQVREFDRIVEDGDAPESYKKIIAAIEHAEG